MTVALFPVSDKRIGHVRKYADRDGGAMRNEKFGHRRFGSFAAEPGSSEARPLATSLLP